MVSYRNRKLYGFSFQLFFETLLIFFSSNFSFGLVSWLIIYTHSELNATNLSVHELYTLFFFIFFIYFRFISIHNYINRKERVPLFSSIIHTKNGSIGLLFSLTVYTYLLLKQTVATIIKTSN